MKPPYHSFALLTTLSLLYCDIAVAEVPPPPAMSAEQATSKPTKKLPTTRLKTATSSNEKPNEQQEQFPIPELVIRYKDGAKIEEYRINGQLRYAKITPSVGPAYYLIDSTGDGAFDQRSDELENPPIQQWLLYSW